MIEDWQIINYCNQLREEIGVNNNALIENIVDVIHEAGYQYKEYPFGDEFSGMCSSLGNGEYVIFFNNDHYWSEKFKRFTLAHELGHLSIPKHRMILEGERLHRSKPEFNSRDEIEIEADSFAINFLAPKSEFVNRIKNLDFNSKKIEELSEIFKISTYATTLRFVELTELACSVIISDKSGRIRYERRSNKFKQGFRHPYLYQQLMSNRTQTYDFIKGYSDDAESITEMCAWYTELQCDIQVNESILDLGYNNLILTLIEPHVSSMEY